MLAGLVLPLNFWLSSSTGLLNDAILTLNKGQIMAYQHIKVPADGAKITVNQNLALNVPNNPIIPFIEGDGIGVDITPVMKRVVDEAVQKSL